MARVTSITIAGTVSASPPVPLCRTGDPIETTYAVIRTGGITYSVQYTLRDVLNAYPTTTSTAASTDWFDLVSGRTASFSGNFAFPVNAVRLRTTAVSGNSANATLWVLQGSE
jgi:hypothetical protein